MVFKYFESVKSNIVKIKLDLIKTMAFGCFFPQRTCHFEKVIERLQRVLPKLFKEKKLQG